PARQCRRVTSARSPRPGATGSFWTMRSACSYSTARSLPNRDERLPACTRSLSSSLRPEGLQPAVRCQRLDGELPDLSFTNEYSLFRLNMYNDVSKLMGIRMSNRHDDPVPCASMSRIGTKACELDVAVSGERACLDHALPRARCCLGRRCRSV